MSGVIVVYAGVGLIFMDVMPIYMIMPRYSHNYALFYQLLDSNLFTHRNTYAILREATSETYGLGSIFYHISFRSIFYLHLLLSNLYHFIYLLCFFTLPFIFTLHLSIKNTKNIISIRSHSRK